MDGKAIDFAKLVAGQADAVVCASLDGVIAFANPAAEALLGYPAGGLVGLPLEGIVPERMREAHRAGLARFRQSRTPVVMGRAIRVPALRQDGSEVPIEMRLSMPFGLDADLVLSVLRDEAAAIVAPDAASVTALQERLADIERRRARATDRLRVLAELGALLTGPRSSLQALPEIARLAAEILGATAVVSIVGRSGEPGVTIAADPSGKRPFPHPPREELDAGPAIDRMPPQRRAEFAREGLTRVLCVPMTVQGRPVGLLEVAGPEARAPFEPDDLTFATQIAERLAAAIARDQLVDALDRERARLETVLDQLPQGVVLRDADGEVVANAAARKLVGGAGWQGERALPFQGLLRHESGEPVADADLPLSKVFSRPVEQEEYAVVRPDGTRSDVVVNAAVIPQEGGAPTAVAVYSDVTLRKENERRERILSEVTRILLDYTGPDEAEALSRITSRVVAGVGDWCTVSLIQPDGMMKQVASFHPDPVQRDLAVRLRAVTPPRHWTEGEAGHVLKTRQPLILEHIELEKWKPVLKPEVYDLVLQSGLSSALIVPLVLGEEPLGVFTLASAGGHTYSEDDLDFAKALGDRASLAVRNARLARALLDERDRLRTARDDAERRAAQLLAVFDSAPSGLALFDADGRLLYVSNRLEELFGLPLQKMVGRTMAELKSYDWSTLGVRDVARLHEELAHAFPDTPLPSPEELEVHGTQRVVQRIVAPVQRSDGRSLGRLVVFTDVTEQRELDRQRIDFLTVAAHELRTPLTPLSMQIQTIERRLSRSQPLDPALAAKARRQVARLSELIDDLLDFSRMEGGRLELDTARMSLDALVGDVVGDFRSVSQVHELVFSAPDGPIAIDGDRTRLEQVLVNLVQNAVKYSPAGGRIVITCRARDGLAEVSIEDPGIGIPASEQRRLFQRFFRATNAVTSHFSGLGVGLYVAQEVVKKHGGRVEVASEVGKGSTFRILLPLAAPPAAEAGDGPPLH